MATSNNNSNCLDPLDSLIDFSEYEQVSYNSPSVSPGGQKQQFSTRAVSNTPSTLPSQQPTLSGPSHNYDLYRQQTGLPQGAIANTLAINMNNSHINQYAFNDSYLSGLSPTDDFVDFGGKDFKTDDMDFDSQDVEPAFFYPEQATTEFIDPSAIGTSQTLPQVVPTQATNNVGRLWPGMHQQQAALAKAQAQQKQQQQIIQQQRQVAMGGQARATSQRPRGSHPPTDPIVEEKISQLLNSMRHNSVSTEDNDDKSPTQTRSRKDEEEMDEDERLLASEEGKKLSSKERRQLRNKVSARAFRSRRKEYIGQLEGEIAQKVNENQDLRSQNRALLEENTRLSDLTRMLLSSPSFSGFLDTLASNPAAAQTAQTVTQPQQQVEQPRQVRKDVNPYAAQQQMQTQHIGMTMIPEHTVDFSMLDLGNDGFSTYQPQVYSVLSLPETVIDVEILSGKSSSSFASLHSEDEKVEIPVVERIPASNPEKEIQAPVAPIVDEEFDSDPRFALYASTVEDVEEPSKELDINALVLAIPVSKPMQYNLNVQTPVDDSTSDAAMRRVERIFESLESVSERLSALTMGL
jgi:hypothetical protein